IERMKRWISLLTLAIFVVAYATPVVAESNGGSNGGSKGSSAGGCSPSISDKTTTKTGSQDVTAKSVSVASAKEIDQKAGNGGEAAASKIGNTGNAGGAGGERA